MNFLLPVLLFNRLNEGGPFFMYPILLMLIICIALTATSLIKGDLNNKIYSLIKHISLFALVWGFLGLMIGLITAFDSISSSGGISTPAFASGLKIGLLSPTFGAFTFLVARLGIILLTLKKK
ncbi:MAG: MotA/TolQ/ExbB proton channel family protein [Flavobacteriaceae bacterium]